MYEPDLNRGDDETEEEYAQRLEDALDQYQTTEESLERAAEQLGEIETEILDSREHHQVITTRDNIDEILQNVREVREDIEQAVD